MPEQTEQQFAITLDTVEPHDEEFQAWLAAHGVTMEELPEPSPNGDPECRYTGTRAALVSMLREHYQEDEEFFDEYSEAV